ncbi:MAG: ribosomal protein S18-alanine N-acetyltransferase [Lachnospiraceae bacterium]|nr:ribosomal protein S18-alanine N-acetyltransferase [Lachnospiraceae bacterium]
MSALIFRPMKAEDLEAVTALEAAAFSRPWKKEDFSEALRKEEYLYFVAEEEGILGVAGLILTPPEADISNVSVAEAARCRGIAKGLLTALLSEGKKRGITDFTLEVRASNTAAIALYEGLGFVCEGIRKAFYSAPREDARIYWLRGE